ncbi:MAG TPA: glycosyltransferase, partial [Candidatus Limnocylindrales bacterium]
MTDRPDETTSESGTDLATSGTPTTDPVVAELQIRLGELERRLESSQSETAAVRERATRERLRFEVELDRHRRLLEDRSRRLEKLRVDLENLRSHRLVRVAMAVRRWARRPLGIARRRWWAITGFMATLPQRISGGESAGRRRKRASAAQERALLGALRAQVRGAPPPTDDLISVIVSVIHGGPSLARCLASLLATDWPRADVVLVGAGPRTDTTDADVETAFAALAARPGWSVTRHVADLAPGPARQAVAAASAGAFVAFIHDDVESIDSDWLRRMVGTQRDRGAGAVGARLIRGRRPKARNVSPDEPADLTLEHRGIDFEIVEGMPRPRMLGLGADPLEPLAKERSARPALTDACLLIPRDSVAAFAQVPAMDPASAAVEFCLTMWASGRTVVYEGAAVLWHHASSEERAKVDASIDPWQDVVDRWGPRLFREVLRDRIGAERSWSGDPLHVAITVTREDRAAPYGDWYTAHELGDALAALGWRISYIERYKDHWYDLDPSVDVVFALMDLLDISRLPRGVVTIAWIRNWTDRWLSQPWFNDYDIVLASSVRSKELVEAGSSKVAHLMPLATNPARFRPGVANSSTTFDAVFVGSDWGEERGVASALPALAASGRTVRLWGRNWESDPRVADLSGGILDYDDVPSAYASARVVVDDTASPTKPYGAVNSRVFDALAAGTIVVTDNDVGARELFDDDFPTWDSPATLIERVTSLLEDDGRRAELVQRYRQIVLDRHTYARRAEEFRARLLDWLEARRIGLHIGPQSWVDAEKWGDTPFARDVQRQLERRGHPAVVLVAGEQADAVATRCDVALHIFGVRAPRTRSSQVRLLWVISHPDRVTSELCAGYDVIFVASDIFLEHLRARTDVPLVALHQATDPGRFYPDPTGPTHELLFVGNSRGVRRPIIDDLAGSPFDLSVYGGKWTPELLDPKYLKGDWIS